MISAKDAVVWINEDTKQVAVARHLHDSKYADSLEWGDPIGAAYCEWVTSTNKDRISLMMATAIDLAMNGYDLGDVLRAFANVEEFRETGMYSFPMCRALTKAIVGKSLEPITMSFNELLVKYENQPESTTSV
jgi:hypothetical protein